MYFMSIHPGLYKLEKNWLNCFDLKKRFFFQRTKNEELSVLSTKITIVFYKITIFSQDSIYKNAGILKNL